MLIGLLVDDVTDVVLKLVELVDALADIMTGADVIS